MKIIQDVSVRGPSSAELSSTIQNLGLSTLTCYLIKGEIKMKKLKRWYGWALIGINGWMLIMRF